ncbi:hypothetical protein DENIT_130178 [Pseudomonas veronii]|nr:hypothetical protein DENIT_130178 [Pseudomonas veronii]
MGIALVISSSEISYKAIPESPADMGFLLGWLGEAFFIVVQSAYAPFLEIRISMSVVGCRGVYGRGE